MHIEEILTGRLQVALGAALGTQYQGVDPQLRGATKPEFGHYQTSVALQLAKELGVPPQDAAQQIVEKLDVGGICLPPEIAGPGFINLTLTTEYLAGEVNTLLSHERLGVRTGKRERVVVDFSSPNVAKQMHVGHLRSTVIGDTLARVLEFVGHEVVRQNHLGDWGTQFGMLIEQLLDEGTSGATLDLAELDALYRRARAHFETDSEFAEKSRNRVVALQSGDATTLSIWEKLVAASLAAFEEMYTRMGVQLTREDVAGESSYNTALPQVVSDLQEAGLLTKSEGALCAFLPGFTARDGSPLPLIVQKGDGGYGYPATDLAALRHRIERLGAERLVYVVDARQALHFEQVFTLAKTAGWLPEEVTASHVAFGTVLGKDGKPFKTRSGETVALTSLLDAAEEKAAALLAERGSDLDEDLRAATARAVGIGAVKYADLVSDLGRDYVFDLDRMLAMDGNTGPYLQYAHARLSTLLTKAGGESTTVTILTEPAEERLALHLLGFGPTIEKVAETLEPHRLCGYLYQVATALSAFYEACPVLRSEGEVQSSRLALCAATQKVLATGLTLLGIKALDRM